MYRRYPRERRRRVVVVFHVIALAARLQFGMSGPRGLNKAFHVALAGTIVGLTTWDVHRHIQANSVPVTSAQAAEITEWKRRQKRELTEGRSLKFMECLAGTASATDHPADRAHIQRPPTVNAARRDPSDGDRRAGITVAAKSPSQPPLVSRAHADARRAHIDTL